MFLDISGLSKNFGGLQAVNELSFSVDKGQIVGLIGPNGSGKTTVFNLITGVHKPSSGQVIFQGKDLTGKPPHVVARNGIIGTVTMQQATTSAGSFPCPIARASL